MEFSEKEKNILRVLNKRYRHDAEYYKFRKIILMAYFGSRLSMNYISLLTFLLTLENKCFTVKEIMDFYHINKDPFSSDFFGFDSKRIIESKTMLEAETSLINQLVNRLITRGDNSLPGVIREDFRKDMVNYFERRLFNYK